MTRILLRLLIPIFAFSTVACTSQTTEEKPNIIFFFTDDQAYDTLGSYGNPDVKTHNIDRLGSQGVIFDRHYDTTAICMASRANVMTGMYEYKTGTNFMHGPMSKDIWNHSFPKLLRDAGYRTGFGGKFGFAVVDDPSKGGKENTYDNLPVKDFDFWSVESARLLTTRLRTNTWHVSQINIHIVRELTVQQVRSLSRTQ